MLRRFPTQGILAVLVLSGCVAPDSSDQANDAPAPCLFVPQTVYLEVATQYRCPP